MGVESDFDFIKVEQNKFYELDKSIMGFAFDIQNEFGNFCDESIYQERLYRKIQAYGIKCNKEVLIKISYKDFVKCYFLDLLIEECVIYEIKTAKSLNETHRQQVINYLLLANLNYGKLINFRPSSVETEFVSTKIDNVVRSEFNIDTDEWISNSVRCETIPKILKEILNDWGAFLDFKLYNEALIHFLGGYENIIKPVPVLFGQRVVGTQKMQLVDNHTALHISGINRAFVGHENNIRKLMEHTHLDAVQWINFNKKNITLKTIKK